MNYTTSNYAWSVMSVNTETHTMVVTYESLGNLNSFNIPQLVSGNTLGEWVDRFAPRSLWMQQEYSEVIPGESGINELTEPVISVTTATLFSPEQLTFLQNLIAETVTSTLSTSTNG